jgi:hypothetical protein
VIEHTIRHEAGATLDHVVNVVPGLIENYFSEMTSGCDVFPKAVSLELLERYLDTSEVILNKIDVHVCLVISLVDHCRSKTGVVIDGRP